MCGITGFTSNRRILNSEIVSMNTAIAHRGPDGSGVMVDGNVGLGHVRLAIIDLEAGQQPMQCEDGAVHITFNGEIYNYREIREKLRSKYSFKTNSDTEVILKLYLEEGENCVQFLRGMFSIAIYDKRHEKLFLARDHLGQKPLFYWHENAQFAFGSEIKALLTLNDYQRKMNKEALHEYLTTRIVTPPRTMFSGINKLPPAHYLTFQKGMLKIKRYWHLDFKDKFDYDLDETLAQLDNAVKESVKYHMVSDVPIGAYLSGGVDSGLVVSMMHKSMGKGIDTFCGDIPYQSYSELPFAREVSKIYGTNNHEHTFVPSLVKHLPSVLWHLDEPSDSLSIAMYCLSELVSKSVKVVLGGDGGDELFGGYDRYYGYKYAARLALAPQWVRKTIIQKSLELIPEGSWYQSFGHKLKWLNTMSLHKGSSRYAQSLSYFYFSNTMHADLYTPSYLAQMEGFDPEHSIKHYFDTDNADDVIDKMLHSDAMVRLPDHPVMVLDRMTMAHGLEARAPFLDHKLAEFCARIPSKFKVKGTQRRYIQMELAKRYLPQSILKRKKQGFSSALVYLLRAEFERMYRVLLKDSRMVADNIWQGDFLSKLLDQHMSGRVDHGQRLWLLCNAELWYRLYIGGDSIESLQRSLGGH